MVIEDVVGELLYIGFVAEKGRCYGIKWKSNYKKTLTNHIYLLKELLDLLIENDETHIDSQINNFINKCKENYEIGKFYNFKGNNMDSFIHGLSYDEINCLIKMMLDDLLSELDKIIVSKRKIYDLLCSLHNLPRVYLGKGKETLCDINQEAISVKDALEYSYKNMSIELREKYLKNNKLDKC